MAKAILVMDMPERCGDCDLLGFDEDRAVCHINGVDACKNNRPDSCPLVEAIGYLTPDLCIERIISYEDGEMLYEREKAKLRELIDQMEESDE